MFYDENGNQITKEEALAMIEVQNHDYHEEINNQGNQENQESIYQEYQEDEYRQNMVQDADFSEINENNYYNQEQQNPDVFNETESYNLKEEMMSLSLIRINDKKESEDDNSVISEICHIFVPQGMEFKDIVEDLEVKKSGIFYRNAFYPTFLSGKIIRIDELKTK